jgi:hypothetical protein
MQDLGEEYIGYSYVDDYGNEEIYWFPVEVIYDGDTGAVEYVPLSSQCARVAPNANAYQVFSNDEVGVTE